MLLGSLWLGETTAAYGSSMTYAAMRPLIAAFGDPVSVGWLVTIFLLVGAAGAAVAARFGDLYGRRRLLLAALVTGGTGLALGTFSSRYSLVLLGRAMQGMDLAVLPLALGIVRENFTPARLPLASGLVISAVASGTLMAMLLGGWMSDLFGWHAVFAIGVVSSALAIGGVLIFVPARPGIRDGKPTDIASALLCIPAIASLLFVVSSGGSWGWTDPALLAILLLGILLAALWVWHSLRHPEPLIDFRLFARRDVLIVNLVYALAAIGAFQVILILSMMMQAPRWTGIGLGVPAHVAGLATIPAALLSLVAAPVAGLLVKRLGGRVVMILSGVIMTLGFIWTMASHATLIIVIFDFCFITLGTTTLYAAGPPVLMGAVPPERTSEALGMMTVVRAMCTAIGAQLVAVLLATDTIAGPDGGSGRFPTTASVLMTLGAIALLSAVATILAGTLKKSVPA
jgi:MFS family permease